MAASLSVSSLPAGLPQLVPSSSSSSSDLLQKHAVTIPLLSKLLSLSFARNVKRFPLSPPSLNLFPSSYFPCYVWFPHLTSFTGYANSPSHLR